MGMFMFDFRWAWVTQHPLPRMARCGMPWQCAHDQQEMNLSNMNERFPFVRKPKDIRSGDLEKDLTKRFAIRAEIIRKIHNYIISCRPVVDT